MITVGILFCFYFHFLSKASFLSSPLSSSLTSSRLFVFRLHRCYARLSSQGCSVKLDEWMNGQISSSHLSLSSAPSPGPDALLYWRGALLLTLISPMVFIKHPVTAVNTAVLVDLYDTLFPLHFFKFASSYCLGVIWAHCGLLERRSSHLHHLMLGKWLIEWVGKWMTGLVQLLSRAW